MSLPKIRPIKLVPRDKPFDTPGWIYEPKYDGYRALLHIENRACWFVNRKGQKMKQFSGLAQQICEELKQKVDDLILDGEIIAWDEASSYSNFSAIKAADAELYYVAFDVLYFNGKHMTGRKLMVRRNFLHPLLNRSDHVQETITREDGKEFFKQAVKLNWEGIVAKRLSDIYTNGSWYKIYNRKYRRKRKKPA